MAHVVKEKAWGEIVADLKHLKKTVSHYEWGSHLGFNDKGLYQVMTVEDFIISFDPATGKKVKTQTTNQ